MARKYNEESLRNWMLRSTGTAGNTCGYVNSDGEVSWIYVNNGAPIRPGMWVRSISGVGKNNEGDGVSDYSNGGSEADTEVEGSVNFADANVGDIVSFGMWNDKPITWYVLEKSGGETIV